MQVRQTVFLQEGFESRIEEMPQVKAAQWLSLSMLSRTILMLATAA